VAIYYLSAQIIGRSAGRSATGAAAYRAGERIHDERTGLTYDYTRRRGDIEAEILAPAGAPAWGHERDKLWNAVEKAERRGDAQVAREIVVAIPLELDREQQRELVHTYVREQFVSKGMVADVAIHRNPGNPHAHIMLTMREMASDGLSSKKNRDWNKPELLVEWRERWAACANHALERAGRQERIDHRSLAEQGEERLPQVHLGPHASALERRGIPTEKGEHNRAVQEHNSVVIDLEKARAEKKALQVEKSVSERKAARLKAGWRPEQAEAMAKVEAAGGGRTYTWQELSQMQMGLGNEYRGVVGQVQAIEDEGRRLERGAECLKEHQAAIEQLRRHQGPLGAVKRLFSANARDVYQQALSRVHLTANFMQVQGVTSEADLRQQQEAWGKEEAKVPQLEAQANALRSRINVASLATRGLEAESARQRARDERTKQQGRQRPVDRLEELLQRRTPDRSMDRGR
jgi:ATP-dependent exoDNAse (exonuclease V) alpha subunit